MKRRTLIWATGIVLAIFLGMSALIVLRVHGALQNMTSRAQTVWDSIAFLNPVSNPPNTLAPSDSSLPFVAVSDFDIELLLEQDSDDLLEGVPEFQIELLPTTDDEPAASVIDDASGEPSGAQTESARSESPRAEPLQAEPPQPPPPLPEPQPNRINFLLVGIYGADYEKGGLLTDAIMVASLDQATGQTSMISLPRDLYVEIPEIGGFYKINAAYAIGERRFGRGLELAMETVSRTAGIPIHYGVRIDLSGLEILVDALGGLDVRVHQDFVGWVDEPIAFDAGVHHMDSTEIFYYVRSRKTTDDFDRARRQRAVLMAIKDRVASLRDPLVLLEMLDIASDHIKTTLTSQEIKTLLAQYATHDFDGLIQKGFDTSPSGMLRSMRSERGEYILVPRSGSFAEMRAVFRNVFDADNADASSN